MRIRVLGAFALLTAGLILAGCTGGTDPEPKDPTAAANEFGTASAVTTSMAEQTVSTPHGDKTPGGKVTVTLRSVEVSGKTMTVRWALRWDDDNATADDGVSFFDMGITPVMRVTAGANLKSYRPMCTDGSWQGGALAAANCLGSQLASPIDRVTFSFPNHGTIEAWALLPAPEGNPKTVDVMPAEGLPAFTGATVTYRDDK